MSNSADTTVVLLVISETGQLAPKTTRPNAQIRHDLGRLSKTEDKRIWCDVRRPYLLRYRGVPETTLPAAGEEKPVSFLAFAWMTLNKCTVLRIEMSRPAINVSSKECVAVCIKYRKKF